MLVTLFFPCLFLVFLLSPLQKEAFEESILSFIESDRLGEETESTAVKLRQDHLQMIRRSRASQASHSPAPSISSAIQINPPSYPSTLPASPSAVPPSAAMPMSLAPSSPSPAVGLSIPTVISDPDPDVCRRRALEAIAQLNAEQKARNSRFADPFPPAWIPGKNPSSAFKLARSVHGS